MTSQELNLWKYGIGWLIQKEQDKACSLAKNQPVGANKQLHAPMTLYKSI